MLHRFRPGVISPFLIGVSCMLPADPLLAETLEERCEEEQTDCADGNVEISRIKVEVGQGALKAGESRYDQQTLENLPTGAGNLSDLLRINPATDFSRTSSHSGSASTRPGEISIHGQAFYENLYMIDGADVTSAINPGDAEDITTPSLTGVVGGSSAQGYYLDTDLLGGVNVYDSNIPARYSGFTGGVVDARLKQYEGTDRARIRYGIQRDEWESFHVNEDSFTASDYYNRTYAPEYRKENYDLSLEQGLSDNLGLTLGLSRRTSRYAQRYENGADEIINTYYDESIDNLLGRLDTRLGGFDLGLSFRYANRNYEGVTSPNYDGFYQYDHQGYGATLELARQLDMGDLSLRFALDRLGDQMDGEYDDFYYHESYEGSGTSRYSGGFGDMEQSQTTFSLEPELALSPMTWGHTRHSLTLGAAIKHVDSRYERPSDVTYWKYDCISDNGSSGCVDQDGDGSSDEDDEYLHYRWVYQAGSVEAEYSDLGLYAEDRIAVGNWTVTPGLRLDWNDYMDNLDLAPRLAAEWRPFGTEQTLISGGLNRYYSRNFLRYQINDSVYGWRESYTYDSSGNLTSVKTYESRNSASDLDTPYSDEVTLAWVQRLGPLSTKLQWVNRETHGGIRRQRTDDGDYYYDNGAESRVNDYSLEVSALEPLRIGQTATRYSLALSYKARAGEDNNVSYDDELSDDQVYYQGEIIDESELPAWDYNIPFKLTFNTQTEIPAWHLNWSNLIEWNQGGTVAEDTGTNYTDPDSGIDYDLYEDVEFDSLVTLDTKLTWTPPLLKRMDGHVQLEVRNLFDETVDISTDSDSLSSQGRQFWLQVGMNF